MVSAGLLSLNVVIAVAVILVLIIYFDINAAISLIVGALYMGLASGMGLNMTVENIGQGFGNLMASIGLPIIFGIMIGMLLAGCGAARQIALTLTSATSPDRTPYAIGLSGAIVAIPVFFDVAFLVLAPMAIAVWRETDIAYPMIIGPLSIGCGAAHTFIPPTPNPLAAPSILNFPLSQMMIAALLVGLPAVLLAIAVYERIFNLVWDDNDDIREIPFEEEGTDVVPEAPSFGLSLLPILTPIVLILLASIVNAAGGGSYPIIEFLGSRLISLLLGLLAAIIIYVTTMDRDSLSDEFSEAMEPIGIVLAITGAGGAFGFVIQETGAAQALVDLIGVGGDGLAIVLLAYGLGLVLRVAQGSGTVAGVTAMTVMAGIETAAPGVAIALAALAGGLSIGHVNDSGFWVVTELTGLEVTGGLKTYTLGGATASVFGLLGALATTVVI